MQLLVIVTASLIFVVLKVLVTLAAGLRDGTLMHVDGMPQ